MDDANFEDLFQGVALLDYSQRESLTRTGDRDHDSPLPLSPLMIPRIAATTSSDVDHSHLDLQDLAVPNGLGETLGSCGSAVQRIEAVFRQNLDLLAKGNSLYVELKRRNSRCFQTKRISFPGKTENEAWQYTVIIRILELILSALKRNVVISKRDIYYQDPALYGSQTHVDRFVDDIAYTFGVSRYALNVTAAARGLVAGAFTIRRRDGSSIDAANQEGILVPPLQDVLAVQMPGIRWILVIEKEASFRSIAASKFWGSVAVRGIIITGKGYPDLSTRTFLRFLSHASPENGFSCPPVFGLTDLDPDGLAILSTYKRGSMALAHEGPDICVPGLQRLGLGSEHLHLLGDVPHAEQGLLPLTPRDRKKAVSMLRNGQTPNNHDAVMSSDLQRMLMLDLKAELQLLDAVPDGMTNLLTATLGML